MLTLHKATKEGFYYKKYNLCFFWTHTLPPSKYQEFGKHTLDFV